MPWTAKQRRYFHAQSEEGVPGMKRLADEADQLAAAGKEKPAKKTPKRPAKKTAPKKARPKRRGY